MIYDRDYYRYSRGGYRYQNVVGKLIIANIGIFILQSFMFGPMIMWFGLVPALVMKKLFIWQIFTYMFLHGNVTHLLFNMFALWIFGREIEYVWGSRNFLIYYIICGLGAGITTIITGPFSPIPTIGASGAIYGLLYAYSFLFPERYVYIWFFIPLKAKYMAVIFGVIEFLSGIGATGSNIAHFAHLGGLLTGYIVLNRSKIKRWFQGGDHTYTKTSGDETFYDISEDDVMGDGAINMAEVNRILDKISKYGMSSLTEEEYEYLQRAREYFSRHR